MTAKLEDPALALSGIERKLQFQEVVNPDPRKLMPDQIPFYNTHGYVKPFVIYNQAQADANRAYFDSLLAGIKEQNDGRDSYAICGYHTQCRGIYDIITNPLILDHVEDLIGPNVVCWGTHFFCKLPHDPKAVPWHQDASFWPFDQSRTVTVWLAIDDADVENSCMHVIPGTHNLGALKWEKPKGPGVLDQEITDVNQYGEPVPFELKAGSMSMHADMIVHGSSPNASNRRRCGLTIRYIPAEVRSTAGWNKFGVICRGHDVSGHWANLPRPGGEDLTPKPWQQEIKAG